MSLDNTSQPGKWLTTKWRFLAAGLSAFFQRELGSQRFVAERAKQKWTPEFSKRVSKVWKEEFGLTSMDAKSVQRILERAGLGGPSAPVGAKPLGQLAAIVWTALPHFSREQFVGQMCYGIVLTVVVVTGRVLLHSS
jgi:hypothetical protein